MPPSEQECHRIRYVTDPAFRAAVIDASKRYRDRKMADDPEGWANQRRAAAERLKERYRTDPAFRAAHLEVQRARQARHRLARAAAKAEDLVATPAE